LICIRAVPRERRKRRIRERIAETKQPKITSCPTARTGPGNVAPSIPKGLLAEGKSSRGPGLNARKTRETKMTSPEAQATGRQLRESNLPSGNSNMRNRTETTDEVCARVEAHAALAPPGSAGPLGASARVAYCPQNNCTPPRTPAARKIHPMALPGRRDEIRAPRVAKVGYMKVPSKRYAYRGVSERWASINP
jgi:hypothetical protein